MYKKLMKIMAVLVMVLAMAGSVYAEPVSLDAQRLDTYYTLALDRIENDDYEKALSYLANCLKYCDKAVNPDLYADIHLKIGCVYTMQKNYDYALAELEEAIATMPGLSEAWLVKTQVYSEMENYTAAADTLKIYIELTGNTAMNETLSQLYASAGDEEKALEAQNAYEAYTSEITAAYESAVSKLEAGQYADAIADFEICRNDATYGPSSIYNIAVCYMQGGDYENALSNFLLCVNGDAEYDGLYYNIGVCCMVQDEIPSAIQAFTISTEKESFQSDALYNRAVCYVTAEEFQLAIDDFTAYLDMMKAAQAKEEGAEPGDVVDVATYYRGVCYLSVNEFEKAAADFTACIEAGLAPSDSLFNRGLTYLQAGSYELAVADFTECIEKDISTDDALFYRSYAYRGQGNNEAALADLTACIEHGYNLSTAYYQRAQVYDSMGDKEHYIADLEASLQD
ncbi:MAG: tetratricopeptide repeat protein [Clostridia bacterium]|nr:tetratricopeptide repeat protein [Clostridia bacterium]